MSADSSSPHRAEDRDARRVDRAGREQLLRHAEVLPGLVAVILEVLGHPRGEAVVGAGVLRARALVHRTELAACLLGDFARGRLAYCIGGHVHFGLQVVHPPARQLVGRAGAKLFQFFHAET